MKNKSIVFLGIMGTLCVGSSIAMQSENPRVQKLAIMGVGSSVLAGAGAALSLATEKEDDNDDPRMKYVYEEIETRRPSEDPEPDDIDLEEEESDTYLENPQAVQNNLSQAYQFNHQRAGR